MSLRWLVACVLPGCGLPVLAGALAPTFSKDVAPILYSRCLECHRQGEAAPMAFTSYREVRPWAKAIKQAVLTGKMPPWLADPHFGKFRNDRRMPDNAIQTIVAWVDGGAPEGDPKLTPRCLRSKPGGGSASPTRYSISARRTTFQPKA